MQLTEPPPSMGAKTYPYDGDVTPVSPQALDTPCTHPGCPETSPPGTRCPEHRREYDRRRSPSKRGYGRQHQKWRKAILNRDPLCVHCLQDGIRRRATQADHIVPINAGGKRFDLENGQGLCASHHSKKTRREQMEGIV